ncbi:MAG: putative toxin-antitoxin system toxin component, PIN family [Bacteroidales bacterium]|nr:putative toxin-antitoxin system toxin component, PIN family [Bacteroidales bacterium]
MAKNKIYAVIDTNVIVSALLSKNSKSSTSIVYEAILDGTITIVYNDEILSEYCEVLSRRNKFPFDEEDVENVATLVIRTGLKVERAKAFDEIFPDPKDIVFYEVAMSKEDAYLVTGNIKHFPRKPFVVTPAEMVEILNM